MRQTLICVGLLFLLLGAACKGNESSSATPPPGAADLTALPLTITPTASATTVPPPPPAVSIEAQTSITLTIWTNPDISSFGDTPGNLLLHEQLNAFDADRPALHLNVSQKAVTGQGSILSYLRAGRTVAPTILPDLILLPSNQIGSAAAEQLIYPLDGLLDPALVADLYPAAEQLGRVNEALMGFPIGLSGLTHLAYNNSIITGTLPLTWAEFVTEDDRLILPASGPEGARLLLQFYLALGGTLLNETNQPVLDAGILTQALTFLSDARGGGLILINSSNIATMADAWQSFQSGEANTTFVTPPFYLSQQAQDSSGFAPIPGPNGWLSPLVEGWYWAISTPDPARQRVAADLIAWLSGDVNNGDWTARSLTLPARRAAFTRWPPNDAYVAFLQQELERTQAFPTGAGSSMMTALADAVFNVVSLQSTPETAANEAASLVQP